MTDWGHEQYLGNPDIGYQYGVQYLTVPPLDVTDKVNSKT
jgi:hypothetical protein